MASTKQLETIERKRKEKLVREHKLIDGVDHKICNKHDIYFPDESPWFPATLNYFYYNNKNNTDHLHPTCIRCSVIKAMKWKKDNPEKFKISMIKLEAKQSRKLDNRGRATKQRLAGKQKIWQRDNPEKCKQYTLNHRQHDISEEEWRSCLKVFEYKCAYCGMTLEESKNKFNEQLHKEHSDHDGYNDLRNAIPACRSCNYKKWAFPMEEWYREQDFYSEKRLEFINWWTTEGYKQYIEDKPSYRIIKEQNEGLNTFHFNLWSIDEMRNIIELIDTANKKKYLNLSLIG